VTPVSNDETYSRLRTTRNEVRPRNERQRSLIYRVDIDQNIIKGVKQTSTKEAPSNTKVNTVSITTIMIVILLILTLVSIVLSVATFSRVQSQMASQPNKDTISVLNLTQLIQIQNNISQTLAQLHDQVNDFIYAELNPQIQPQCGAGLWWRVAYLDMTEPSQQCPSAWREYNEVRACGRPDNSIGSCAAVFYFTKRQYSKVCGRIIGYQVASPDAFKRLNDKFYGRGLDGVIISHGAQQDYIWSFAAGLTDGNPDHTESNCPCSIGEETETPTYMYIGEKFYCESGNPTDTFERGQLYSDDRLWDGEQCEGSC
jgi:hypothetical protein